MKVFILDAMFFNRKSAQEPFLHVLSLEIRQMFLATLLAMRAEIRKELDLEIF
jgi:hypothetical protein